MSKSQQQSIKHHAKRRSGYHNLAATIYLALAPICSIVIAPEAMATARPARITPAADELTLQQKVDISWRGAFREKDPLRIQLNLAPEIQEEFETNRGRLAKAAQSNQARLVQDICALSFHNEIEYQRIMASSLGSDKEVTAAPFRLQRVISILVAEHAWMRKHVSLDGISLCSNIVEIIEDGRESDLHKLRRVLAMHQVLLQSAIHNVREPLDKESVVDLAAERATALGLDLDSLAEDISKYPRRRDPLIQGETLSFTAKITQTMARQEEVYRLIASLNAGTKQALTRRIAMESFLENWDTIVRAIPSLGRIDLEHDTDLAYSLFPFLAPGDQPDTREEILERTRDVIPLIAIYTKQPAGKNRATLSQIFLALKGYVEDQENPLGYRAVQRYANSWAARYVETELDNEKVRVAHNGLERFNFSTLPNIISSCLEKPNQSGQPRANFYPEQHYGPLTVIILSEGGDQFVPQLPYILLQAAEGLRNKKAEQVKFGASSKPLNFVLAVVPGGDWYIVKSDGAGGYYYQEGNQENRAEMQAAGYNLEALADAIEREEIKRLPSLTALQHQRVASQGETHRRSQRGAAPAVTVRDMHRASSPAHSDSDSFGLSDSDKEADTRRAGGDLRHASSARGLALSPIGGKSEDSIERPEPKRPAAAPVSGKDPQAATRPRKPSRLDPPSEPERPARAARGAAGSRALPAEAKPAPLPGTKKAAPPAGRTATKKAPLPQEGSSDSDEDLAPRAIRAQPPRDLRASSRGPASPIASGGMTSPIRPSRGPRSPKAQAGYLATGLDLNSQIIADSNSIGQIDSSVRGLSQEIKELKALLSKDGQDKVQLKAEIAKLEAAIAELEKERRAALDRITASKTRVDNMSIGQFEGTDSDGL
ncbi:MAG: hypothetical protein LBI20_02230 [Holosporales bacterium]|jgi:hypothetical protein|nr:hypothetical protein [Holosporales bacterium]